MKNRGSTKANHLFYPKLLSTLKNYNFRTFLADLSAGTIVAIVALPLAIAFAIASGVTPEKGIITAIVAGFIISALGGSRVQIGGPTGAFVVIVYGIVQSHGIDGLLISTVIAGVMLIMMGVLRLGGVIKFIPYPLTVGFTAGIAVVIFFAQLKDFFGLDIAKLPAGFIEQSSIYYHNIGSFDLTTLTLSILSLFILIIWPKVNRRVPGSIVAVLLISILVAIFNLPVETIGSRFGELPSGFPMPSFPTISFEKIRSLMMPAFTIAMLGAIESLLSATVADSMINGRHRSNTELIAQGVANIITPFFGGIPATGAIARTATNVRNGGKTPISGIIHALMLLLFMMLLSKFVTMIPLCVLSAILLVVAYHMSEWRSVRSILKAPKEDILVLAISFFLTVLIDLTVAVEIGLLISLVLFVKRMQEVTSIKRLVANEDYSEFDDGITFQNSIPDNIIVYEAEGAFFFGVAELLRDTFDVVQSQPEVLILRMRHVLAIDATGIMALRDLHKKCASKKIQLIISGIHEQPRSAMEKAGLLGEIGSDNVFTVFKEAFEYAQSKITLT